VSLSVRAIRRFTIRPALPEPLAPLRTLMLNLRWSWHEPVRALFAEIDADAWEASGRDPAKMLALVPLQRLTFCAAWTTRSGNSRST
jgi:starch phosphorylase